MSNRIIYLNFFLIIVLSISFQALHSSNVQAQVMDEEVEDPEDLDDLVHWTDEGMLVFVSNAALSEEQPNQGRIQAVIYRQIGTDNEFEEVARLQRPDTWEEFAELGGTELIKTLFDATDNNTEEELWNFIKENPDITEYGFLGFDKDLWRALGTVYFDTESVELDEGQKVTYQIRYVLEDGEITDFYIQGSARVGQEPNLLRPQYVDRMEREDRVGVRWFTRLEGSEDAFFGKVYKQIGQEGDFEPMTGRIMARRDIENDIIIYEVEDSAEPNHAYRYYIEPLDLVGNSGPPSDTLTVISVDFDNLPLIGSVSARDTISGIHLAWEPIDYKPYLTGIEIQRSRQSDRGYLVLDTLSVQETEYLDTRLVPNRTYYYRFRIVTIRELNTLPSAVASASFRNTEIPPSTPSGLRAVQEGDGIRLHWDSVEEPDLFGYYVYRGTSRHDSMAVVSRAIRDTTTFLDHSEELHGRTNYVYAVRAVNMSDLESELSNMVVARPDRLVRPPRPMGIAGYAGQNHIRLSWRNEQRRDGAIAGYHLYRTTSQPESYPEGESATVQAERTGFERINSEMVTATSFEDIHVVPGETYYYALSTEDQFGVESTLSETSWFRTDISTLLPPSQVSARTVSGGVEIRWNRTLQQNVENYRIYKRARGEENPSLIGTVSSETTRFTDENVAPGTIYWYSVSVVKSDQESSRGREQSVTVR